MWGPKAGAAALQPEESSRAAGNMIRNFTRESYADESFFAPVGRRGIFN